ncbi:hypothetical protein FPRO03_03217 [Fusarium proliferatum]|nr:hypothetical protein FPRO03_03217 [Fusarium proliferatum]
MEGYESIQSNFALQKFGFGVDLMCCELPRISSSGISIPANYVLENFHHSLQIYCDALSNEFLASFKNSKSETWPLDQCCLMLELAACIQQQRTTETLPPSAKYHKLAEAIATRCNHTTIFILLRQVYSCFWLRCEGDLQGCRLGLLRACQYRKEIDQHDGQYSELEGRIWSYLTVWDRETSILLWQPRIIETASGGVDLSYFLASQNVHRELVVWSYDTLSASQSLKELATALNSIRPLDFQMSRSTHSRFQYQIPELSLEGVGFVFGDGTVVAEPQAIPQLRGALRRMPKPVTYNQAIRIWIDEAVIELSFSEPRQSAGLLRLQGNRVRVTAEFSSQIPGQEVKVLLWNQNDGSRRQIGPATKSGRTRWHINITCKDLLGHAVMFSYHREEVISVPVTSEILVSPVPESPEQTCPSEILMSPVPESSELTSPSESGSSLAAADATVGLPQAEREPPCAWVYTYGVGDSALKDILIKHNSDYYTCQAYPSLRKRLIASVKEQHPETGSFKEL